MNSLYNAQPEKIGGQGSWHIYLFNPHNNKSMEQRGVPKYIHIVLKPLQAEIANYLHSLYVPQTHYGNSTLSLSKHLIFNIPNQSKLWKVHCTKLTTRKLWQFYGAPLAILQNGFCSASHLTLHFSPSSECPYFSSQLQAAA